MQFEPADGYLQLSSPGSKGESLGVQWFERVETPSSSRNAEVISDMVDALGAVVVDILSMFGRGRISNRLKHLL
jgi:hypothetical protein